MDRQYFSRLAFYLLVILVGAVTGVMAIFFRELIGLFHNLFFFGQFSFYYDTLQHTAPSPWGMGIILVPVIGGICVTYLVKNHAPEARGSGVPEVMKAIYFKQGMIRPIVAVVRALASSISIGSGASVGREGPIIHIGAALGSTLGRYVNTSDRIILVACGAGGGIAASFNTPFTGILFALEFMLPEISAATILPVSLATAIATFVSYLYFGNTAFLPVTVPPISQVHLMSIIYYVSFGIFLGLCSAIFIRGIYFVEDSFDRLHQSYYIKHILGMLIIGLSMYGMMYFFDHYYVQGLGYATVYDVLNTTLKHPGFLLFLALVKAIDTAISIGSGASGGIFSPLVFIGATLGGSLAGFSPGYPEMNFQLTALAGIAAIIGASTGASLMSIIMAAEFTGDLHVVLPLIVVVMIASGVRRMCIKDNIFTYNLSRHGHIIPEVSQRQVTM